MIKDITNIKQLPEESEKLINLQLSQHEFNMIRFGFIEYVQGLKNDFEYCKHAGRKECDEKHINASEVRYEHAQNILDKLMEK